MDPFNFNSARKLIPDAEITLIQEDDHSITETIPVNRFLLVSMSDFFRNLFYWNDSPENIIKSSDEASDHKEKIKILKNGVFASVRMFVLNVKLFSELIDSLYMKNIKDFIISKPCEDALTILEMCFRIFIKIPYLEIIKLLKGDSKCFHQIVHLLHYMGELKVENVALLAGWIDNDVDFTIIEDEEFVEKLKIYLTNNVLVVWDCGTVGIYNLNNESVLFSKKLDIGRIMNFSFSKSHQVLALITDFGDLYFFDVKDFTKSAEIFKHANFISQASFSSDGNILAVNAARHIELYEYPSLKLILTFGNFFTYGSVHKIAWDPKGTFIAISFFDRQSEETEIRIFRTENGDLISNAELCGKDFKISKDGKFMVIVSESESGIAIFSTENWEQISDTYEYGYSISNIDISPDGEKILINFNDVYENKRTAGKLLIIDSKSGAEILSKNHYLDGGINVFTPDGTRVLVWLEEIGTKKIVDYVWWINIDDPPNLIFPVFINLPKIKKKYEYIILGLEFITLFKS